MRRHVVLAALTLLLVGAGAGVAAAGGEPDLAAHGPTAVSGTEATAVFRFGDRTIRQIRYADRQTLTYSFALSNDGRLPVTVTGLAPLEQEPRLFRYTAITDADGSSRFTIAAGQRRTVLVSILMHSCETLSAGGELRDRGQRDDLACRSPRQRGVGAIPRRGAHGLAARDVLPRRDRDLTATRLIGTSRYRARD